MKETEHIAAACAGTGSEDQRHTHPVVLYCSQHTHQPVIGPAFIFLHAQKNPYPQTVVQYYAYGA